MIKEVEEANLKSKRKQSWNFINKITGRKTSNYSDIQGQKITNNLEVGLARDKDRDSQRWIARNDDQLQMDNQI